MEGARRGGRSIARAAVVLGLTLVVTDCRRQSDGEKLARTYCAACHEFPEPQLLDKKTWLSGVLPQMAPRLGVTGNTLFDARYQNPLMVVLPSSISKADWQKIVAYYQESAPDSLPYQSLPAQPQVDPPYFQASAFAAGMQSSGIITLLKVDSASERIFIGEAGSNTLRVFDWNRRLLSTTTLGSPPTDLIVQKDGVLVLEAGILNPNDQARGSLVRYAFAGDSLRLDKVVLEGLIRPVFVRAFDFDKDGQDEFVVCEFGNNVGRLALYKYDGSRYQRRILDPNPGAIRFEIRDMTGDGAPDIVALFAQGNERIELLVNDGKGNFGTDERILARFPPVYGSMYFSMYDFNGDGKLDIVYVNGDNFDYSRILKPYHGVRILENDGSNNFRERYFFPVYGAARAEVADFDRDGDLDMIVVSNFADSQKHPERGIMYLENLAEAGVAGGAYKFRPYAFSAASSNQWNVSATADLNRDGFPDVIVGGMNLGSIGMAQGGYGSPALKTGTTPVLFLQNLMTARRN
ncbi:MAG: FG-GAP repeat domain-containing protein [Gemmatimonadaceae bacterium]